MYKVGKEVWMIDNARVSPRWVGNEGDSMEDMIRQLHSPFYVKVSAIVIE